MVVELTGVDPHQVVGRVRERRPNRAEPRLHLTLYQAALPREKMELVLQKGTEVGVSAFVPVTSERTLAGRHVEAIEGRLDRWRRIATEAAEQCRRGRAPEVRSPLPIDRAFDEAASAGAVLVAWESEQSRSIRAALTDLVRSASPRRVALFIGPEGGFSASEIDRAVRRGASTVSLGRRILRAETAGPVVAALVLYEAGDMDV